MPGAMHRMGVYLGLVEDDEYEADGFGGNGHSPGGSSAYQANHGHNGRNGDRSPARRDEWSEQRFAREPVRVEAAGYADYGSDDDVHYAEEYSQSAYQITALHPRTYNEARTIGEHFRKSTPVIMNLTDMDDADAKRLVDFAAGLTFGLHGRIERVTAKVFLLSPHNVSVTAQDKAKIENGFFNQS
ncbi:cell division protein SepF [uncultured Jatrophihabitans sp.]|uniref:cell division protein SepF n=1 Tax=uncultured Jatrophihabitans sp. TaxID=1610747 RepID=UPI0035C9FD30